MTDKYIKMLVKKTDWESLYQSTNLKNTFGKECNSVSVCCNKCQNESFSTRVQFERDQEECGRKSHKLCEQKNMITFFVPVPRFYN